MMLVDNNIGGGVVARFLSRWFLWERSIIRCQIKRTQIYEQDILVAIDVLSMGVAF